MQRLVTESAARTPNPAPTLTMGAIEWTLIVLHSIMWGSAYFFGAIALRELPSLTITAFRLIPACIIVVGVCWMAGNRIPRTAEYWRRMLVLGVTNNVLPMMLILFAQHQVSGGIAAVFNAMTPLIAVVLAHFVTVDEKFTAIKGSASQRGSSAFLCWWEPTLRRVRVAGWSLSLRCLVQRRPMPYPGCLRARHRANRLL